MIYTPNYIFVPVAYLGIVGSKRIFSGANPAYTLSEIVHQIHNTTARLILAHLLLAKTAVSAAKKAGLPDGRVFLFSDVPNDSLDGPKDWRDFLGSFEEGDNYRFPQMSEEESIKTTATVNYLSGTIGLPKGVEVSFLPLYHAYGQLYTIAMAKKLHTPVYIMKLHTPVYIMKQFQYEEFLRVIQTHKITYLQVAPPIMGMTEVTCGAIHVPGGTVDNSGSVGQLNPNCECMLLDDDGNKVPEGQPGEIYRNEHATRESLSPDGWLKTGDVAVVKKGWFWIIDRKKVNALQVAPAELEAVLLEHNGIADAAVPRAYVHLKDNAKSRVTKEVIYSWMKEKVAKYKQPVGGITFVNKVPKLQSEKIMRKVVKEWVKRDAELIKGLVKARL
ncbi:acetyl-CoA synthetase-like protein [Glonium stellatum]|uniref:Acetyl-CoA synthetase-like protein n=1 Tax=Glonium stellatum TaxID=574774 RepID=A0A8E2JTD1_9PEZI|nr:acetyl-CoA synthetase-like protein [Glonium stellatum]